MMWRGGVNGVRVTKGRSRIIISPAAYGKNSIKRKSGKKREADYFSEKRRRDCLVGHFWKEKGKSKKGDKKNWNWNKS